MKYYIITFGCQMNKSDSERIAAFLESRKYEKAKDIDSADLVLVNMCSVRQSAVDRVFGLAGKLKGKKTILAGCLLKKDRKKLSALYDEIWDIKRLTPMKPKYRSAFSAEIPIMTGCNNFCSYCVVPYARGKEISRPAKEIICEIKGLAKRGYKEIWLLGQNVNSYKDGKINFPKLLKIVNDIPGKFWLRFTSSHPKDFSDKLIDAMAECKKVSPYLNLPVQAGDDKVLKTMNRRYTIKRYKNLIKKARAKIPNIVISTDIIVGFPGETKKQFRNSLKLFREIKYDMAYISEYSSRFGTAAAKMEDTVSKKEKAVRKNELNEVLKQTSFQNNKKYIGKTLRALINFKNKQGNWVGKTWEYKTIQIKCPKNLLGKFANVSVQEATAWQLKGKIHQTK